MVIESANAQTTMNFTPMERGLILEPGSDDVVEMLSTKMFFLFSFEMYCSL